MSTYGYVMQSPLFAIDMYGLETCFWLDQGNAEKCKPTGLRRTAGKHQYQTKEWFPAPDPSSPSLQAAPRPSMPVPGLQITWRTVFREKGYWEIELSCTKWGAYTCRDDCGKVTQMGGNMPAWKRWEKSIGTEYDEVTGRGDWSNVGAPPGPQDLDLARGGPSGPQPRRIR